MADQEGLPDRGLGSANTLGSQPALPARRGGTPQFTPEDLLTSEVFPGRDAATTIRSPSITAPAVAAPVQGAVPEVPPVPTILIPNSFDEMLFHAQILNPSREVSTVVEQTIAAGATGTVTVTIPINVVDVTRTFREGGDGSVTYRIEVDGVGRNAIADHRITGGERQFSRFWEKYNTVVIAFTNNDLINPALIQVEWISLQIDSTVWIAYRSNIRNWSLLLGVTEV